MSCQGIQLCRMSKLLIISGVAHVSALAINTVNDDAC
jgi:hypothetical protein